MRRPAGVLFVLLTLCFVLAVSSAHALEERDISLILPSSSQEAAPATAGAASPNTPAASTASPKAQTGSSAASGPKSSAAPVSSQRSNGGLPSLVPGSSPAAPTTAPAAPATSNAPSASNSTSESYPSISFAPTMSTSVTYDVMAAPSTLPPVNAKISNNVTIPAPAMIVPPSNKSLPQPASNMYRGSAQALANMPKFYYNIANSTAANDTKAMICELQVQFCATAKCKDVNDTIEHNFCDVKNGMATMCTCKNSRSRLAQYQWPVQSQDCLMRLQHCVDTCNNQRETPFAVRSKCMEGCQDQIGSSCMKPEQYGASYMVSKPGQKPSYHIVDQSQPQNAGARALVNVVLMGGTVLLASVVVLL